MQPRVPTSPKATQSIPSGHGVELQSMKHRLLSMQTTGPPPGGGGQSAAVSQLNPQTAYDPFFSPQPPQLEQPKSVQGSS